MSRKEFLNSQAEDSYLIVAVGKCFCKYCNNCIKQYWHVLIPLFYKERYMEQKQQLIA